MRTPSAAEFPPVPPEKQPPQIGPMTAHEGRQFRVARTARQSVLGSGKRGYNVSARLTPFPICAWHGVNYQRGYRMRRYVVLVLLVLVALLLRGDSRP